MNPSAADASSLQMDSLKRRLRARQCRLSAGRMYLMVILRLVSSRSTDSISWSALKSLHSVTSSLDWRVTRWLNDNVFCSMVGRSMYHSLTILGLGLGASEMEIKVHYRQLARKYHPDKNNTTLTGLTTTEASDFFKLLNNAHEYLRSHQ